MKYSASLRNEEGCIFDNAEFSNVKKLKDWAKGRTGKYIVIINRVEEYIVKNNRIWRIK
jgi:hypothetical protein